MAVEQQLIDTRRSRSGFSVLEAMIALVITGLALTLIFSIGNRASTSGFSLGRRVLGVSDRRIETLSISALIKGLSVPSPLDFQGQTVSGHDMGPENLIGTVNKITGSAILERDTICADAGPVSHLEIEIQSQGNQSRLICRADKRAPVELMTIEKKSIQFSYSLDGNIWQDSLVVKPGTQTPAEFDSRFLARTYFIRLSSEDLDVFFIEKITTGRPRPSGNALDGI